MDSTDRLAALCRKNGEQKKASEQLVKAAGIHIKNGDFGLGRRSIEELLAVDAGNQEGARLLQKLEALQAPSAAPAPARAESPAIAPTNELAPRPFQHSPQVVKTSVAGITAKLRNLQSNDPAPGKRAEETGAAAAKIDEVHADTPSADTEEPGPAPDNPPSPVSSSAGDTPGQAPPTARIQQKLGGAASRLAALRKSQ